MDTTMNNQSEPLLEVKDLKTYFFLDEGTARAIDGVDFNVWRGQTLGVVGESGCGKSVTARSILRIVPKPGKIVQGEITLYRECGPHNGSTFIEEVKLTSLNPTGSTMRSIRGAEIALVPQEPMASLSPVHTIGNQIMKANQIEHLDGLGLRLGFAHLLVQDNGFHNLITNGMNRAE